MLNLLPDSTWHNPNRTWLEPGSGFGGFTICVINRLLIGLEECIHNFNDRLKHILENMVYMVEFSKENVDKCRKLLGDTINVYHSDFLKEWKDIPIQKFDIILGNPPFNYNGMRGKGRKNKDFKVIWPSFIEISLTILKKDGYLLFFTPNSWTEFKSRISKSILDRQLLYYRNYDVFIAYKIFDKKAGSLPLCYFLLQNTKTEHATQIYDKLTQAYQSYNIYDTYVIPNMNINLIKKIIKKTRILGNLENNFFFTPAKVKKDTTKYQSKFSQVYCFPLINYTHKKLYISYSSEKSKLQNLRPKLIFPNYSMGYPILDVTGILDVGGRSSYVIYIEDDTINKLKKLQRLFFTPMVFAIINSLKTAQKFLSTRTFDLIPKIYNDGDVNFDITDNDTKLNKYFNLNEQDITGIDYQLNKGEGNLTVELKQKLINFSINDILTKRRISYIVNRIKDSDFTTIIKNNKRSNIII